MTANKVRVWIIGHHIILQTADCLDQEIQEKLTPIELRYILCVRKCSPIIYSPIIVFCPGCQHMTHHKNDKCNLEAVLLELAGRLSYLTHEEFLGSTQAMNPSLVHP